MNGTGLAWNKLHAALAILVLGASAGLMQAAQSKGWLQIIKKPLPVRKPLEDFNRSRLEPFTLISSERFPPEMEEDLGTREYLNWLLKEPTTPPYRGRQINLAVTYYTGVVDQVPHVAEECMTQGAFTLVSDEVVYFELPSLDGRIPIRRQTYFPPRDMSQLIFVYYTISVNGDFHATRTPARRRMADWSDTHLYYSKVEISVRGSSNADQKNIDERAIELLDRVLSELVETHWPLRGWEKGGPPPVNAASSGGPRTGLRTAKDPV